MDAATPATVAMAAAYWAALGAFNGWVLMKVFAPKYRMHVEGFVALTIAAQVFGGLTNSTTAGDLVLTATRTLAHAGGATVGMGGWKAIK